MEKYLNGKILISKIEYKHLSFNYFISDVFNLELKHLLHNDINNIYRYAFRETDEYYEMLWCDELFYNNMTNRYKNSLMKDGYLILIN